MENKYKILFFFLSISFSTRGQSFTELKLMERHAWYPIIIKSAQKKQYIDSPSRILEIIGNAYYYARKYDSAILFFNLAISKDSNSLSLTSVINLESSYFLNNQQERGKTRLKTIAKKNGIDSFVSSFIYGRLGLLYLNINKPDSAIFYLEKSVISKNIKLIRNYYYYLARAYLLNRNIDFCMKILKKLDSSVYYPYDKLSKILYDSINSTQNYKYNLFNPSDPKWKMISGDKITYFFDDTIQSNKNANVYILEHEKAYNKIDSIFHSDPPSKLTMYVCSSMRGQADGISVGHTDPIANVCYVGRWQTIGHEITHAISYWGWGYRPVKLCRLINEGLSVTFDMQVNDKIINGKNALIGCRIQSIIDIWDYFPEQGTIPVLNDADYYAIAGAFVSYLYGKCTRDQFEKIVKNQSIDNIYFVLGRENFSNIINDFNATYMYK